MTVGETVISVWQQTLIDRKSVVELESKTYPVGRTRAQNLRTVQFAYDAYQMDGIEQNPATSSNGASLARAGKRIIQFSHQRRYIANVCEGKLTRYPAWVAFKLPE